MAIVVACSALAVVVAQLVLAVVAGWVPRFYLFARFGLSYFSVWFFRNSFAIDWTVSAIVVVVICVCVLSAELLLFLCQYCGATDTGAAVATVVAHL